MSINTYSVVNKSKAVNKSKVVNELSAVNKSTVVNELSAVNTYSDINYACICNNYFKKSLKVVILYPCSHILHSTCYIKDSKKCPFCDKVIKSIIHEDDLYKCTYDNSSNYELYQQILIDLESTRLDSSKSTIHYNFLPINIIKSTSFINKLLLATEEADLINCVDYLFNFINIKINVIDNTVNNPIIYTHSNNSGKYITWKNQIDKNNKKILIVNHSHYLDSIVLYYLFRTGFVASEFINKLDLGRLIVQKCKLLIFKRGVDTNMVNKIKEYLEEKRNIVIYPEGSMGSNDTIRKFRTGAFYADAHICPIIIKYNPFVWDDDYKTFILKLISQKEIVVDIHVNDLHAPPFSTEQIQKIRQEMITTGNMKGSRVSNRCFKD
jgi:1-acyl-sn-glycerol-3-phosphate acyltransferase